MSEEILNRLADVEAQTRSLKEAIIEIKEAVVAIRATMDLVARVEERAIVLSRDNHNLQCKLDLERDERKESAVGLGVRLGETEKKIHTLEAATVLNSHGRSMFERVLLPVLAAAVTALVLMWIK